MTNTTTKKKETTFFLSLFVLFLACFLQNFEKNISSYISTMFAINYDYGPIPNGLMGSILKGLDVLLPIGIYSYNGAYIFSILFTALLYILFFVFYRVSLTESCEGQKKNQQYLIMFLSIFAFSMFSTSTNFGYFDLYLYIFTLISILLIIKEKGEWLIVPFGIVCMFILQDFVFSNAAIIFVLLLYKILLGKKEKRGYYIGIATAFLISVLGLFVFFEFFCTDDGASIVDTVKATAQMLSEDGNSFSNMVIKRDILQDNMTKYVANYRLQNKQDLPTFCILFAPYIFFGVRYFIKLITNKTLTPAKRFLFGAFLFGGAAMIPLFVRDIYYGRYVFHVIFYYVALVIALIAMQDKDAEDALDSLRADLKKITPLSFVWILYPIFLLPLRSVAISNAIHKIAEMLFG